MSQQLCIEPSWGAGLTRSVNSPNPFLRCLNALTGNHDNERLTRYLIQGSVKDLLRVARLPENWDRAGSIAPRPEAVANALARLPEICAMAIQAGPWIRPHISASENGDITFEWWNGSRKVTMYFGSEGVEVIRVWGPDIDNEMQQMHLQNVDDLAPSWAWLYAV